MKKIKTSFAWFGEEKKWVESELDEAVSQMVSPDGPVIAAKLLLDETVKASEDPAMWQVTFEVTLKDE